MATRFSQIPYVEQEPHHMLRFEDYIQDVENDSLPCTICNAVFAMNGLLDIHYEKVHGYPPTLNCFECKAYFKRKRVLMAHYRSSANHVSYNVKYLGCDICDAFNVINGFRTQEELEHHSERVHGLGTRINDIEQDRFVCPIPSCNSMSGFAYRKGMIEHVQIMHGDHLAALLGLEGDDQMKLRDEMHQRCPHCSRVYRVKESLDHHVSTKHTSPQRGRPMKRSLESSMTGEMLDFEPPTKSRRMGEPLMSSKDAKKFSCQFCPSNFSRQSVLNMHVDLAHKGGRELSESLCTLEAPEEGISTEQPTHEGIENGRVKRIVTRPRTSESLSKPLRTNLTSKQPSAAQSIEPSENEESEEESEEEHFPLPPNFKLSKPLEEVFNEAYFADNDPRIEDSLAFFERKHTENELDVECVFEGCPRKFPTTNSMNRHVAFYHRPDVTARLMKLAPLI